jgi:hypothetical protein
MSIAVEDAFYIKLGRGGEWEEECLKEGTIRFGYRETPHDLCLARAWDQVRDFWTDRRGDVSTATRDMKQIQAFYEADQNSFFITFANGLLHWCRPVDAVEVLPDRARRRSTVDGWRAQSLGGVPLSSDRLSGHLLKVQMFKGTICQVKQRAYLLRKLNDELSPRSCGSRRGGVRYDYVDRPPNAASDVAGFRASGRSDLFCQRLAASWRGWPGSKDRGP